MPKWRIALALLAVLIALPPCDAALCPRPPGCVSPLDDETLNLLTFGTPFNAIDAQPGQRIDFDLYDPRSFEPVNVCARWTVSADSTVASIDAESGVLTIGDRAVSYPLTVTVSIEDCRRVMSIRVYLYELSRNPLVGAWRELRRLDCNGQVMQQGDPIQELVFRANGEVFVLFRPFEFGYFDYWGRYAADADSGGMTFEILGQNQPICCSDRNGRFSFDRHENLVFERMSFGAIGSSGRRACKYVLFRLGQRDGVQQARAPERAQQRSIDSSTLIARAR